jgi:hypothetical protein
MAGLSPLVLESRVIRIRVKLYPRWHIHSAAVNETFDCSTAGGHFYPYENNHGAPNAGDSFGSAFTFLSIRHRFLFFSKLHPCY